MKIGDIAGICRRCWNANFASGLRTIFVAGPSIAGFVFLGATLCSSGLFAQTETGQITGTVLDPSGSSVAGAKITATEKSTDTTRATVSTSSGAYSITNLLPGTYTVTVTEANFQTYKQDVRLAVGATLGLDIHLVVGSTATIVEVRENTVQVNTETQTLSQNISGEEVVDLPTISRNPYDLVKTAGNVSDGDTSGRGAGVAINGMRASGTNILLDGISNNDQYFAQVGTQIPIDSVGEFTVLTSDYTAEFGRAGAGVINVTTKQGTNVWHGTGYEFNRVSGLASNTFDNNANGIKQPVFTRNQFGYSVGGPVVKNKLFVFENTEWIRIRSQGIITAAIPTPQLIAASAPATQAFFSTFGALAPNLTLLQTFPRSSVPCSSAACLALPANTPIYQKVAYSVPTDSGGGSPGNIDEEVGRIDYNFSEKDLLYFRIARYHELDPPGSQFTSPYAGYDTSVLNADDSFALSGTHIFSPRAISQTKIGYSRIANSQEPLGTAPLGPTLYTTANTTSQLGNAAIAYPGYVPFNPSAGIPSSGPQNLMSVNEDFTWISGRHSFRFGGSFQRSEDDITFGAYEVPVAALGTNTGNALDNLLAGQLHSFVAAVNPQGEYPCVNGVQTPACTVTLPVGPPNFSRSNVFHDAALYAQDSWKLKPRLTLNLGLRWDYFGPQGSKNPNIESNFYLGAGANIEQQIGTGSLQIAQKSPAGGVWKRELHDFGPRVGFAYALTADGKTSLRGGYGISYERNFGNVSYNIIQNPPNYAVITLTAGVDVPTIAITNSLAGPLAGSSGTKALGRTTVRAVNPNIKTAYAHEYSLTLERQISREAIAGLDYSGSVGENLYTIDRTNIPGSQLVYNGTGGPTSYINNQYGLINFRTNGGNSIYNSLTPRIELRNFRTYGLTLRASYTWSHSIDDGSSTFTSDLNGEQNLGLLDPLHPGLDRGDSDFDIRHRFVMSAIWNEQFFKQHGVANLIGGGWSLSPIWTARTGTPFTVWDCTNENYALCPRAMFDTKFNPVYTDTPTGNPNEFTYLNLGHPDSSYANAQILQASGGTLAVSDFGPYPSTMSGRNVFRTPGVWSFNLGAYKTFALTERFKMQFRAEAFDLFNHSNLYLVYTNTEVSSAPTNVSGQPYITATRGLRNDSGNVGSTVNNGRIENRNLQLALKLIF